MWPLPCRCAHQTSPVLTAVYCVTGAGTVDKALSGALSVIVFLILKDFFIRQLPNAPKRYVMCPVVDFCNHSSGVASDLAYEYFLNRRANTRDTIYGGKERVVLFEACVVSRGRGGDSGLWCPFPSLPFFSAPQLHAVDERDEEGGAAVHLVRPADERRPAAVLRARGLLHLLLSRVVLSSRSLRLETSRNWGLQPPSLRPDLGPACRARVTPAARFLFPPRRFVERDNRNDKVTVDLLSRLRETAGASGRSVNGAAALERVEVSRAGVSADALAAVQAALGAQGPAEARAAVAAALEVRFLRRWNQRESGGASARCGPGAARATRRRAFMPLSQRS